MTKNEALALLKTALDALENTPCTDLPHAEVSRIDWGGEFHTLTEGFWNLTADEIHDLLKGDLR